MTPTPTDSPLPGRSQLPTVPADEGDAIRLAGVVRHQGGFTLGPLDLRVPSGTVTGFVGPNGAGKTTTLKAILAMVPVDAGAVTVLGGAPGSHHERIGVSLDTPSLAPEWEAGDAAQALRRFYPVWDDDLYADLLRVLRIPADRGAGKLSRGEGQKLSLALALAHRPDLLILDEPTSGLDPSARHDVLDVLREFMVDERHSILFSTHIVSDLEHFADHLHILSRGRTAFAGTVEELTEAHAVVRAPSADLDERAREALIGPRVHGGATEALIRLSDTALFPPTAVIEAATLDEAVAALGNLDDATDDHAGPEDPANQASPSRPTAPEEH